MLVSSLTQVFSSSTGNKNKLPSFLMKYFKFEVLKQLCEAYRVSQVQVLPFLMPEKPGRKKKNRGSILRGIYWSWLQYFFCIWNRQTWDLVTFPASGSLGDLSTCPILPAAILVCPAHDAHKLVVLRCWVLNYLNGIQECSGCYTNRWTSHL